MSVLNWNDPKLLEIGQRFAAEAYNLASELIDYGADATVYLLDEPERTRQWQRRPEEVCIPTPFMDAIMAILISLPRPKSGVGRRRGWSTRMVQAYLDQGMTLYAAAREVAERTGVSAATIERGMRVHLAKKKKAELRETLTEKKARPRKK